MKDTYLFFDIDGTLFDHKDSKIPASALDALTTLKQNGHHVFISSGRSYVGLQPFRHLDVDGFIFSSGAGIELHGKLFQVITFSQSVLNRTIHYLKQKEIGYSVDTLDGEYMDSVAVRTFKEHYISLDYDLHKVEAQMNSFGFKFSDYVSGDALKMEIHRIPNYKIPDMINHLDPAIAYMPQPSFQSAKNNSSGGEIRRQNVTKGSAVKTILKHYSAEQASTFGFGDSMNDLELLQSCQIGIAMGNADQELKKHADYITSRIDEDGIMNALLHFKLI